MRLHFADDVVDRCEVCQGSDKVLYLPFVGTSTVSLLDEKVKVDHLSLDDVAALHAQYLLLVRVR